MAINLLSVVARHERRLRLVFDNAPAAAAFTSTTFYTVTSTDNRGVSPTISGALAIASNPNAVDLALGADLVSGAQYLIAVTAMPAIDTSTCTGSTPLRFGDAPTRTNQEIPVDDGDSLLYGTDLVFDATDFVETVDGDLDVISGLGNAQQAVRNRLFGEGLPWDPSWGAYPRQYVDGTPGSAPNLKGALIRQAYADDRVSAATAELSFDPNDPAVVYFDVLVTLIGGETLAPVSLKVLG